MITIENQTPCQMCGRPIEQRSPRVQLYCTQACRQRAYRSRLTQHEQGHASDQDAQARITELEQEAEQRQHSLEQVQQRFANYVRMTNERLSEQVGDLARDRARIAELEQEVRQLHDRLNVEARFLSDTESRHFKVWLRKQGRHPEGSFAQRFLDDKTLPLQASRAMFEALLRKIGYSPEDVLQFREMWKAMLL